MRLPDRLFAGYVFDLDGTLYLGDRLLPGASETVAALRAAGSRVAFLTNKPLELPADYAAKLTEPAFGRGRRGRVLHDALVRYLRGMSGLSLSGIGAAGRSLVDAGLSRPTTRRGRTSSSCRSTDLRLRQLSVTAPSAGARIVDEPDLYCPTPTAAAGLCRDAAAIEAATGARRGRGRVPSPHGGDAAERPGLRG
jgi:NagD protein